MITPVHIFDAAQLAQLPQLVVGTRLENSGHVLLDFTADCAWQVVLLLGVAGIWAWERGLHSERRAGVYEGGDPHVDFTIGSDGYDSFLRRARLPRLRWLVVVVTLILMGWLSAKTVQFFGHDAAWPSPNHHAQLADR